MTDRIIDQWVETLEDELVEDLVPDVLSILAMEASQVATGAVVTAGAASTVGASLAATGAGISTGVKLAVATAAAALAVGAAAATGVLPEPVQTWVSDVVEQIGIDLPDVSPSLSLPLDEGSLPGDVNDVPDLTVPDVVEPDLTVPSLPLPDESAVDDAVGGLLEPTTPTPIPSS